MNRHPNKLHIVLAAGIMLLTGCVSSQYVMPPADLTKSDSGSMDVLTKDGTIYSLEDVAVGPTSIAGRGIRYAVEGTIDSSFWSIPISEIEIVQTGRVDPMKSLLVSGTVGVLAVVTIGAMAASGKAEGEADISYPSGVGSCPFVFTFDGEKYHLESETFAGAVCQGLERTNLERLQHLREVDGVFHIALSNQRPESQHVNELRLFAVDHPPGTQVVPDIAGRIRTVRLPVAPTSVQCMDGRDAIEYVKAVDGRMWESELQTIDLSVEKYLRDGLVCEFTKPKGATRAKLIINGLNSILSNYAVEIMFSQPEVDRLQWFHLLNTDPDERGKFIEWITREGGLEVSVWTNGSWVRQGWFPVIGPHISAEKMIALDVSGGDTGEIRVKMETARDLWRIDRIAIDFSDDETVIMTPLPLRSATTESGIDIINLLASSDSLYYGSLPGEYARITYDTVAPNLGMERSFMMESRGYYYEWTRPGQQEISRETVERILTEPLYGSRIFLPRWREIKAQYTGGASLAPRF